MRRPPAKRVNARRRFLLGATAGLGAAAGGGALWLSGAPRPIPDFATPSAAMTWLAELRATPHRSLTAWPLPQVLEHLAQSIEYSIDGYPQLRPAWFRASVGPLAFATFARRGRMSHDTTEPIPGAPRLQLDDASRAVDRLSAAWSRFLATPAGHRFAPHFAYGDLDRRDYLRAHLLHLADHAREIVPA